jgi:RimJ/RimL family protein N-acetyltransferase
MNSGIHLKLTPLDPLSNESHCLWQWRNDKDTLKFSRNKSKITWQDHIEWYLSLKQRKQILLIAYLKDVPIGMSRLDLQLDNDKLAEISLNLAPEYRGKGYGRVILNLACTYADKNFKFTMVWAEVEDQNVASLKIFSSNDFIKVSCKGAYTRWVKNFSEQI